MDNFASLKQEFLKFVEDYSLPENRWPIIQEYLPGSIAFVSVVYDQGRCVALSSTQPLRHKNVDTNNNATLRQTADYHELMQSAKNLMDQLKWHGIAQLEFIPDHQGIYKLNEINARPWGSIAVPVHSGVDIPWLWYLVAIGQSPDYIQKACRNIFCRWILGDSIAMLQYIKKRDIKMYSVY